MSGQSTREAIDQSEKGAFLETAEEIAREISALEREIGIPSDGLGSSLDMFYSSDTSASALTPAHYLGMARFSMLMATTVASRVEGYFKLRLDMFRIANQCLATARVIVNRESVDAKTRGDWARLRHSETYALRDEAHAYWKEFISPTLSNEKAAVQLAKIFPISHRTLSKYVSEFKKQQVLPPASRL